MIATIAEEKKFGDRSDHKETTFQRSQQSLTYKKLKATLINNKQYLATFEGKSTYDKVYDSLDQLESLNFVKFTENMGLPAIQCFENLDGSLAEKSSKCHKTQFRLLSPA